MPSSSSTTITVASSAAVHLVSAQPLMTPLVDEVATRVLQLLAPALASALSGGSFQFSVASGTSVGLLSGTSSTPTSRLGE